MIELLKYLKGYVRIKVWGFSPERFMNLCSNRNILLWDIVREDDVYYMCVSLNAFYQLRPIVRKTGTRAVILKRYGLPFFVPVIWARKVFVLGIFLCVAFWTWSSFYIWNIELEGNYQITEDVFFTFLKENDISVGMRKGDLDIETLEKAIRRGFPQITWTSARLSGTSLDIDIKENDAPIVTAVKEEQGGRDLISEFDGTVETIFVRSGVPKVTPGTEVKAGDILVEGKVPVYNEDATVREYQYVASDADITIRHVKSYEEKLPFDYIRKEYTGRTKKRYFLRFGEQEWRPGEKEPFQVCDSVIRTSRPMLLEKLSIPVYWGSCIYREYQNVEYEYSVKEAEEILKTRLNEFISGLNEKGVQIIEKNVKIETDSGNWIVRGFFQVVEKAGKTRETAVENIPPSPEGTETGENGANE